LCKILLSHKARSGQSVWRVPPPLDVEGKVARGNEKLNHWACDKSGLFSGLMDVSRLTSDERYLAYVERSIDWLVLTGPLLRTSPMS
jgi:hypothetical protein